MVTEMIKEGRKSIKGIIQIVSGTRIGGSDELLQIGATDLNCIKHPISLKPYLPGSSLKGKMRSELEKSGKFGWKGSNNPCGCKQCLVCRVFGAHGNKTKDYDLGPTRILVRDSQLLPDENFRMETKAENVVGRRSGTSNNFFKGERVAGGAKFKFEVVVEYWSIDKKVSHNNKTGADALVEFIKDGLRLLQETGIGAGTSKGYGEIEFLDLELDGEKFNL